MLPRRQRPRSISLLLALGLLAGCRGPAREGEGAWQRFDLWSTEAKVEGGTAGRTLVRGRAHLGPYEVRPASLLAANPERRVDHLAAGEITALRQTAGARATWKVALGSQPYLSFVPLREAERGCDCGVRVEVRKAGGEGKAIELYRGVPQVAAPVAAATVYLDLGRFAGRTVELTLAVDPPPEGGRTGKALWGSPAVYSRVPLAAAGTEGATPRRPNVVLIGIDTLRADALGAYGRRPSVTPALDRLAAESDVWMDAFSCFNVTNPSFASLLTGLYGKEHGVYDFETPLPAERTTLAELFSGAGYDTRAILSIDHLRHSQSGLGQGFAEFSEVREQRAGEASTDLALDWIAARRKPFFLWLHLFDPHTPHTAPKPFAGGLALRRDPGLGPLAPPRADSWAAFRPPGPLPYRNQVLGGAKELYASEVAYTDLQVGRLVDFLRSRRLLERTIVVVIADHGENLEDHGVSYRHSGLWDTTTHVPLLIRWPGAKREARRLSGLVQNVDVFPTLLAAAGLPVPPQDGLDLRALTAGAAGPGGRSGRRAVFAEHTGRLGAMVRTPRYLYMTSRGNRLVADGAYLYDLERDPGELANLAGRGLPAEADLDALLRRWLAARSPGGSAPRSQPLSPDEVARLRALGYQ